MNKHKNLMVIGAGGHGRVVADVAARSGKFQQIVFLDDAQPNQELPYPYLGKCDMAENYLDQYEMVVAIGNGEVRQKIMRVLADKGACFATIVAPDAIVASDVQIGAGTVVFSGVVINTGASIGQGVIVNTASSIDHDCMVGDFCHIAVGARLCGTVRLAPQVWVGAGAVVINNLSVDTSCVIGAGAVVVKNIEQQGVYIGVPAKNKADL